MVLKFNKAECLDLDNLNTEDKKVKWSYFTKRMKCFRETVDKMNDERNRIIVDEIIGFENIYADNRELETSRLD